MSCPDCMPCCGCDCCTGGYEDGIITGKNHPIPENMQQPLSKIFQELVKSGKINGQKPAVEFKDTSLSFLQLEELSTGLSRDIRDHLGFTFKIENPDKDPIIATILPASEKQIVLMLAILKIGGTFLPLDPELPEAVMLLIIDKFRPLMIIACDKTSPVFNKYEPTEFSDRCKLLALSDLWADVDLGESGASKKGKKRMSDIQPTVEDLFEHCDIPPAFERPVAIFPTRGFRYFPRGVRISHLAVINQCLFEWDFMKWKESYSSAIIKNTAHADTFAHVFSALLKGSTLHIFVKGDLKDPVQFIRDVVCRNVSRVTIPFYYLSEVLQAINTIASSHETLKGLKCVKMLVCSGGCLRHEDGEIFFGIFKNVPIYNSTWYSETSGPVIYEVFTSLKNIRKKEIAGRTTMSTVLYNTKVYVLGEELGIITDNYQGESCISGQCLAMGYVSHQNVVDARDHFVENPHGVDPKFSKLFRSGDYVRIIKSNGARRFYWEGRDEKFIRQKGHEFYIADIIPFLLDLPNAKDASIYLLNKGKHNQEMIAFIKVDPGAKVDKVDMDITLRGRLPEWSIPHDIMVVNTYPKHYYNETCPFCLLQEYREQREPSNNAWETMTLLPDDKKRAAIFLIKAVFRMTSTPVDDIVKNLRRSFFEVGGTSLSTIPFLAHLNHNGYKMTMQEFFSCPTLIDLISFMTKKRKLESSGDSKAGLAPTPSKKSSLVATLADGGDDKTILRWVTPDFYAMPGIHDQFVLEPLKKKHKSAAVKILSYTMGIKGEISHENMISYKDCEYFFSETWQSYLEDNLSFVVKRKSSGKVVAVALCQDFFKKMDTTKANGTLFNALEFFHEVKGNVLLFLPHRIGETMEMAWMGTDQSCSPQENIKVITFLHTELIRFAEKSHSGVYLCTCSILSRSLCTEVFNFELFDDFKLNKYEDANGSRPFHLAVDTLVGAALYLGFRAPNPPSESTSLQVIDPVSFFNSNSNKGLAGVKYYHQNHAGL